MAQATRHSALFVAAFVVMAILNYAFGVGLSWLMTTSEFGVLGVAQSLLLVTALAVGSGFNWLAAREIATGQLDAKLRRRFRSGWLANVLLAVVIATGLWGVYWLGWIRLGPAYRWVIPLVGLTTVLLAARSVVNGAAQGLYRFEPVALNLVGEVVVKVVLGLLLVWWGFGVDGVILAFALGAAAALIHGIWIVRPAQLWRGAGWFDRNVLRTAAPLFVGMLGPALILNLDILGLKLLSPVTQGDELAGYYQAAVILARTPVFMARMVTTVIFSYVAGRAALHAAEGLASNREYVSTALRAWLRLLVPISLVLIVAPDSMLRVFFPQQYLAAVPALRLTAAGSALLALVTIWTGIVQAADKRTVTAVPAGLAVLVQGVLLVWLVPALGTVGAALSLCAAGVVAIIGLLPVIGLSEMRAVSIRSLVMDLFPLLTLLLVLLYFPVDNRFDAVVQLVLAALVYALLLAGAVFWRMRSRPEMQSRASAGGAFATRVMTALIRP